MRTSSRGAGFNTSSLILSCVVTIPILSSTRTSGVTLNTAAERHVNADVARSIFQKWANLFYEVGNKLNRTFKFSDDSMDKWAAAAGFTNIEHKKFKIP